MRISLWAAQASTWELGGIFILNQQVLIPSHKFYLFLTLTLFHTHAHSHHYPKG
jgi:hypothetical protein